LEQGWQVSALSSYRAVVNSLYQSAKRGISDVKQLGWILAQARFYAYLHDVTSPKGLQVNLEQGWQVSALSSYRAVVNSLYQSAKRGISDVKQRGPSYTDASPESKRMKA
jgi:uncharacterized protein YukE